MIGDRCGAKNLAIFTSIYVAESVNMQSQELKADL